MIRILLSNILLACILTGSASGQAYAQSSPNDWVWQRIGIPNGKKIFQPVRKVKVAIIEGSVDMDHPILKGYAGYNTGEIPENNMDDDRNGLIDDYSGWDFADNDNNVMVTADKYATQLHGTQVADVFIQTLNVLIDHPEQYVSILPVKARSDFANNNYITAGYKAIEYAISQQVDIILCCWGGVMVTEEQKRILAKADSAGIIIIATAGNYFFQTPQYPGAFNPVICVSATDRQDTRQTIANYGGFVDILAPGDSILSIGNRTTQRNKPFSGTSAAAPVVAAVTAAMRTSGYNGSAADLDRMLKNSARPVDAANPMYAGKLGAGVINVTGLSQLMGGVVLKDYTQAKAYIDLHTLSAQQPVKVHAEGRFKSYRLILKTTARSNPTPVTLIAYRNGNREEMTWPADKLRHPVEIEADSFLLYAAKDAGNKAGNDRLYYEAVTIDSSFFYCSGTTQVKGAEGIIEDGSGDDRYTGRNDCKWLIEVPEGKKIKIDFTEFDTEPKIDQIYIFNGTQTNDPILAIFSGPDIPPVVITYTNRALVWFVTNEAAPGKGWKLHYKAVDN